MNGPAPRRWLGSLIADRPAKRAKFRISGLAWHRIGIALILLYFVGILVLLSYTSGYEHGADDVVARPLPPTGLRVKP